MVNKQPIIVKAPFETRYLENSTKEKVEFLNLDNDADYSIDEDIKGGATQFVDLKKLMEKPKVSRVVAVSADNKESGLIAVSYLAMAENKRINLADNKSSEFTDEPVICTLVSDGKEYKCYSSDLDGVLDDYSPFPFNSDNMAFSCWDGIPIISVNSQWVETSFLLPVVSIEDLIEYYYMYNIPDEAGGLLFEQKSKKTQNTPYWLSCQREPVCIVVEREMATDNCLDLLSVFSKNRHVYVLFIDDKVSISMKESFIPFAMDANHFNALKNNFILSNAADAVSVFFDKMARRTYYKNIFKQNLKQRGIRTKSGFSYEKALKLAESVDKIKLCEMIDKIINYALKDETDTESLVFDNNTFNFMVEFGGSGITSKERASGRELLEKNLVGMEEVKKQVLDVVNVMKYNRIRSEMDISRSDYHNVHLMLGAPGTAKTTVAKYMGQIMVEEKLLPDNRVICINGAQLKGMYVGHSAPKTRELFDKYDVIIIDEAYSLVSEGGKTDSFGNEAIAQMIIEIENHSTDKLVVFAGYGGRDVNDRDNRMKDFLDANPGIKSRITSTFYFKSYTAEDMGVIFQRLAKLGEFKLQKGACELVVEYFRDRITADDFGNGREARSLLENVSLFAARRLMESGRTEFSRREMCLLTLDDVKNAIDKAKDDNKVSEFRAAKIGFAV